jgi:hypothetical protein
MRKQAMYMRWLAALILLAGISGCAAAPKNDPEPEGLYVMQGNGAPASVRVTNQSGTFTVENRNMPDEVDRAQYYLLDIAEYPPDRLAISVLMERAGTLEALAYKDIAGDADLAAFGLSAPQATLAVTYADGSAATLLVGNTAEESGTYCMQAGGERIYLVESTKLHFFFYDALQFLDKAVTAAIPQSENVTMELDGSLYEQGILLQFTARDAGAAQAAFDSVILQPRQAPLSEEVLEPLQSVFGLRASRIVCRTTGADGLLEAYGLDAPYCRLRVYSAEGDGFTLRMTEPDGTGHAYLLREGVPFIYEVSAEQLPWLAVRLEHMTGELPFLQEDAFEQMLA